MSEKDMCRCGHRRKHHYSVQTFKDVYHWPTNAYVKVKAEKLHFCDCKPHDTLTDQCRCLKFRRKT